MGIAASPGSETGSGSARVLVASSLMLLFWVVDAAFGSLFFGQGSFSQLIFAPEPHDLWHRCLLMLLVAVLIGCSSRASRVRSALEGALQEALEKAEGERLKAIAVVEAVGDAISIQDPQLIILYQNRAHQEQMGSHVGEHCYAAYRQASEACPGCHLVQAFSDGAVHRVEIDVPHARRTRCVEIIGSALKDPAGRITAGIEVVRDITERKLAERTAKREAALLQHLIDTIPNPIYHLDPSGRFLWCNTACALWLARPRELVIGRTVFEVATSEVARILREQEPCPGPGTVQEAALRRGDGELRDVIFYRSVFNDCAGEQAGVVGVIVDITQRKRAEQEVIGLNAALTRQSFELHHANREMEAFAHSISHDLRSPLTRIYSSGQALQEYADLLGDNGRFFVKTVNDGCRQLAALIDSLMVLCRASEVELVMDVVELSRIAQEKAAELQQSEPERLISFQITPQLRVQGDPQLLQIALENLVDNAWKYTTRVAEAVVVFGSLASAEGETVYFVKDNGAGFDEALSADLFRPFRRLHAAEEFPGTGLGLATVRRIIRRHHGRIWAEGEPGCGATFYFTLPG